MRCARVFAALIAVSAFAGPAVAVDCDIVTEDGNDYTVCTVDPAQEPLHLFRAAPDGTPYGTFSKLDEALRDQDLKLVFAMNAGMYHLDRSPVGHYIENGNEEMRVISSAGPGNFGLLPNGVFCIGDGWARVIETLAYLKDTPDCRGATQSGPMLVIDGALHPAFLADSSSRYIRNGVGTDAEGSRVVFAISEAPVTFHEFGRLFRDRLGTPNALFLDGNVSRLHAPEINRSDLGFPMGPIVGVVAPSRN